MSNAATHSTCCLYDLTDPDISQENWFDKNQETKLPEGMSVKDLIFRFTSLKGSSAPGQALQGLHRSCDVA